MKRLLIMMAGGLLIAGMAAAEDAKTFSGKAGCAHCNFESETGATSCAVSMKVGDMVYRVKPAEDADEGIAAKLSRKNFKGAVSVDGTIVTDAEGNQWIAVSKVNDVKPAEGSHKHEGSHKEK